MALEYIRNFSRVPWLDVYAKVDLQSTINSNYENLRQHEGTEDSSVYPKFMVNGVNGTSFGLGYMEGGARFGGWGTLAVRQNLLLRGEATIPIRLAFGGNADEVFRAGSGGLVLSLPGNTASPLEVALTLYGGISAFPYRIGKWWNIPPHTTVHDGKDNEGQEGLASSPSITDLYGGISLAVGMGWTDVPVLQDMGIALDASWRTDGSGTATTASSSLWKLDSADSLKYNGRLRVQATVSWAPTARFSAFSRFRYEYRNVIPLPGGTATRRDAPMHEYYVQVGLSYRFGGQK